MDSSGNVTAFNVWGANGLLSRRTGTANVYYTFDPDGSVVQRLDINQNILSTSAYDAWGNPLVANPNDPFGYDAQWGYYTDNETGLLLLTHRYYDPTQGRFLTRDPIGFIGSINPYLYVWNNSIHIKDPLGLFGIVIGDPTHPTLCFGDCAHPTFDFGYPGSLHDYFHSPWWGCISHCMASAYGIGLATALIGSCFKFYPGGSKNGGGKWGLAPPDLSRLSKNLGSDGRTFSRLLGLTSFDLSMICCEYRCSQSHSY